MRSEHAGFTLIELMAAVAVLAVLLTLGLPSFEDFIRRLRLSGAMGDLIGDLNLARGEAIKRNARVLVCPKSAASDTCAPNMNWTNGWIVCYDANADDICDPNPLRIRSRLHSTLTLNSPVMSVRFNSIGAANVAAIFTLSGTWSGSTPRTGEVMTSGLIRSY